MAQVKFSCRITGPGAAVPLELEVYCDGVSQAIFNPVEQHEFSCEFADSVEETAHTIEFHMRGKTSEHTQVNDQGEIVSDYLIYIHDKQFEAIDVDYAFDSHSVYTHDFNGSGSMIQDGFSGIMGCNGTVRFEFTTPIYLWMLENL